MQLTPKIKCTQKTNDGRRQQAAVLTSAAYRKALFTKSLAKAKADDSKCSKPAVIGKANNKTKGKKTKKTKLTRLKNSTEINQSR